MRFIILVSLTVCSAIGAYLPNLWGDHNILSLSSLLFSTIGGLAGIWVGWKIGNYLEV